MCCARARTGVITSTSSAASSVARQTARSPSASPGGKGIAAAAPMIAAGEASAPMANMAA